MTTNVKVTVRLSPTDYEKMNSCVNIGTCINVADFMRQAVREKLDRCGA